MFYLNLQLNGLKVAGITDTGTVIDRKVLYINMYMGTAKNPQFKGFN